MNEQAIRVFSVDDIDARVIDFDWRYLSDHADTIAAHWSRRLAEKPAMFDGRVLLMKTGATPAEGGILRTEHFETSFSAFLAWSESGFPDRRATNCFSMAALLGADGGYVLAEMGDHTSNAGQIYFPSGTPDLSDVFGDKLDLDGSVLRELEEETGLSPREVSLDAGWIVVDTGPKLGCMKTVRINAPAADIARDINARIARQSDPELKGIRVARGLNDIDPVRMPEFLVAYLTDRFTKRLGV